MDRRSLLMTGVGSVLMVTGGVLLFVSCTQPRVGTPAVSTANVAGQPVPDGFPAAADYTKQVFDATNAARVAEGLPALPWDDCAAGVAAKRIAEILPTGTLEHPPLVAECGDANLAGEDLGHSIYLPAGLVDAWMDSPGHRANVVNPEFQVLGVACVASALADSATAAGPGDAVGGMLCSAVFEGVAP